MLFAKVVTDFEETEWHVGKCQSEALIDYREYLQCVVRAIEATMVALLEWKAPHAGSRRFKSFRYHSIGIFSHFGSLMVKATAKLLLLVGISGRHQTLKDLFIQITRSSVEHPRMGIMVA